MDFGVKCGTEEIKHANHRISQCPEFKNQVLLQNDAKNAFNSISRQNILDSARTHTPYIARWVHFWDRDNTELLFGTFYILSSFGKQQRYPLGPLIFALDLQPLILSLQD